MGSTTKQCWLPCELSGCDAFHAVVALDSVALSEYHTHVPSVAVSEAPRKHGSPPAVAHALAAAAVSVPARGSSKVPMDGDDPVTTQSAWCVVHVAGLDTTRVHRVLLKLLSMVKPDAHAEVQLVPYRPDRHVHAYTPVSVSMSVHVDDMTPSWHGSSAQVAAGKGERHDHQTTTTEKNEKRQKHSCAVPPHAHDTERAWPHGWRGSMVPHATHTGHRSAQNHHPNTTTATTAPPSRTMHDANSK